MKARAVTLRDVLRSERAVQRTNSASVSPPLLDLKQTIYVKYAITPPLSLYSDSYPDQVYCFMWELLHRFYLLRSVSMKRVVAVLNHNLLAQFEYRVRQLSPENNTVYAAPRAVRALHWLATLCPGCDFARSDLSPPCRNGFPRDERGQGDLALFQRVFP